MSEELSKKINRLPPNLQQEVEKFVDDLMKVVKTKRKGTFRLDWRGALSDMRGQYTSVELQHKILEWWGD